MRLPESWVETRLTSLLESLETGSRPTGGVGEIESGIPSISGEHFGWNGVFDFSSLKYIPEDFYKTLQTGKLRIGDILIVKDGATTAKCSYIDENFPYEDAAINEHVFLLRANSNILDSRFLFEILRSEYGRTQILRSYRGAAIGGIPRGFTDHIKLPLPALSEQRRIVDVLRHAEAMTKAKQSVNDQIDHLVRTTYWEHFGNWYTANGLRDSVRISEFVANSQYGVSEAMEETGPHIVLRMNSITTNGWLNLSDLKYANLSKKDIESTELKNGDLLFNRTNSKELVGKCAIWRDAKGPFSFASYLVRLRLKDGMLPEYLWATLNSAYGKYRLINSAKQAVSMANVSPTDLGRITVPLPPLKLQEKFSLLVKNIELLRNEMLSKLDAFSELQNIITQQALLGELTANWRERNQEEITATAKVRDALLRELGAKISKPTIAQKPIKAQDVDLERPTRHWLIGELSEFQRQVLAAFKVYYEKNDQQPLLAEDPDVFAHFCEDDEVAESLQDFGPALNNRIRRTLSQLAALGLIAKVTLPKQNLDIGEREYLKAFRPLREAEYTRLADVAILRKALSADEIKYHFGVTLDWETSAHAGADGTFQVADLRDENDQVRTDLVDQGKHYINFEELAYDIAQLLDVRVDQIKLEEV